MKFYHNPIEADWVRFCLNFFWKKNNNKSFISFLDIYFWHTIYFGGLGKKALLYCNSIPPPNCLILQKGNKPEKPPTKSKSFVLSPIQKCKTKMRPTHHTIWNVIRIQSGAISTFNDFAIILCHLKEFSSRSPPKWSSKVTLHKPITQKSWNSMKLDVNVASPKKFKPAKNW